MRLVHLKKFWKEHRAVSILIVILLVFSVYSLFETSSNGINNLSSEGFARTTSDSSIFVEGSGEGPFFEIESGSVTIESEDATTDSSQTKDKVEELGGRIEGSNRFENSDTITVFLNTRIPKGEFDEFVDWLNNNYEIDYSSIGLSVVDASYIQNEINVLLEAVEIYDRLLERAEASNDIETVARITDSKLNVVRQLRQYGFSLDSLEERENMSQLSISFVQEKEQIFSDDFTDSLDKKWRQSVRDAVESLTEILTGSIVVLANTLKWIVYGIIILIPLLMVYRIYKKTGRKLLK